MKREAIRLINDIKADRNREESLNSFINLTSTAYLEYATIKLSLNYFTFREMIDSKSGERLEELEGYMKTIEKALSNAFSGGDVEKGYEEVKALRETLTERMRVLTAYTSVTEIYEYIINRLEYKFDADIEEVFPEELADEMYDFVFSDNDKLAINSKIQSFVAQLPVRMTKTRFYDIISNSFALYKGGEKKALDEFVENIRDAALLDEPPLFDTMNNKLYEGYKTLKSADYNNITKDIYEEIKSVKDDMAYEINDIATDYMLLVEVINDALIILSVYAHKEEEYLTEKYETSVKILNSIFGSEDIYKASEEFDPLFISLEGAQENAYDILSYMASNVFNLDSEYTEDYSDTEAGRMLKTLEKIDRLTGSSLFADIDEDFSIVLDAVDDAYIEEQKQKISDDFTKLFEGMPKTVKRAVMAKVLAIMPVFFNEKEEIREYFRYTLSHCSDKAELYACSVIIDEIIND